MPPDASPGARRAGYPRGFMAARYLTTPIYYVNDRPHIGHLYTTVVTDTLARYFRLAGEDVRFLTGTDEHGQNIEKVAKKEGVAPIVVADRHAPTFRNLWKEFGIANDDFIRTTEPRHRVGVEEIIRRIDAAGDLYTASHEGWYCAPCEAFYPEKDLVDGQVSRSRHDARAAEGGQRLLPPLALRRSPARALSARRGPTGSLSSIPRAASTRFARSSSPDSRTSRSRGRRSSGASRSRAGPGHVVYVWLDALVNYITALGFGSKDASLYERYWPGIHVIGKDILRFHAVYWPAFLMSAGLDRPAAGREPRLVAARREEDVQVHGQRRPARRPRRRVRRRRAALAPRLGDVVRAGRELLGRGLSRRLQRGSRERPRQHALARREDVAGISSTGRTPPTKSTRKNSLEWPETAAASVSRWRAAFEGYRLQEAAGEIRALLGAIDSYITTNEPWRARPEYSFEKLSDFRSRVLYDCLEALRVAAVHARADRAAHGRGSLRRLGIDRRAEDSATADLAWGQLPAERPAPVRAAALSEGGRERIFCFQRRRHRRRFEGEPCDRRESEDFFEWSLAVCDRRRSRRSLVQPRRRRPLHLLRISRLLPKPRSPSTTS